MDDAASLRRAIQGSGAVFAMTNCESSPHTHIWNVEADD